MDTSKDTYPSSPTESRLDLDNPHIRKLFPYIVAGYPSVIRGCPGYPPVIRWLFTGYPLLFVAVSVLTIAVSSVILLIRCLRYGYPGYPLVIRPSLSPYLS